MFELLGDKILMEFRKLQPILQNDISDRLQVKGVDADAKKPFDLIQTKQKSFCLALIARSFSRTTERMPAGTPIFDA